MGASDSAAVGSEAATDPMASTHWEDDTGRTLVSVVTIDDASLLPNHRPGFDTVTDVTVCGVTGFLRAFTDETRYVGLVWHDSGFTYTFGSQEGWVATAPKSTAPTGAVDRMPWSSGVRACDRVRGFRCRRAGRCASRRRRLATR